MKAYIEAHLSENITVATLASLCHMSGSCFSRVFKASTGHTLCQWITRVRLQRARTLLASSTLSIAEIANAIGFHDQSHFVRKFKQVNGVSARDWRAQQLAVAS
ncbi:MAG: helix-turn-helix transcriptional regulator [Herbaspirillum sp.]|nr:helix-turn-helix transcriptional regulator [Herbaspirillum sp.]